MYSWNTVPTQTNATAYNLLAGSYVVTVTDAHGCTATSSVTISGQSSLLMASFAANSTTAVRCYGESTGSATVSVNGGTPGYTYLWNTIPQQTTQTATNLSAGQYYVTVTDSHNCTAVSSVTVVGQSSPLTANFSTANVNNVDCHGNSNGSAMVSVAGGTPMYQYLWNTVPVQTNVMATGLSAGNYSVTITDANLCTASAEVAIAQPALLQVSTSSTSANCGGMGGSVNANAVGGTGQYSYSWTNGAGQTFTGVNLNNVMPSTYYLTVTDINGCTASNSANVERIGNIAAVINIINQPGCGSAQNNGALEVLPQSGIAPFSYQWSNGSNMRTANNLSSGTYSVTITDAWGCTANANSTIEQGTSIEISVSSTNTRCYDSNDGSANVVVLNGVAPYTYSWSNGSNQPSLQNIAAGQYMVTVTGADMCTQVATITITNPERLVLETNVTQITCYGKDDGSITLSATGGSQPYSFSIGTNQNTFVGNYANNLYEGIYNVEVTDVAGCYVSNLVQLVEPDKFNVSYMVTMPSCSGNNDGSIEISATGGTAPYMYGWDTFYSDVPLLTGLREGHYEVMVIDANQCSYSVGNIEIIDNAGDCISIPNVFTPNGDGINDQWIIENIEIFPDATIYVFNRWGQMLYKGRGSDEPWDGTYNGKYVPAGTYLYIVDLYQKTEAYEGTVTVIY